MTPDFIWFLRFFPCHFQYCCFWCCCCDGGGALCILGVGREGMGLPFVALCSEHDVQPSAFRMPLLTELMNIVACIE